MAEVGRKQRNEKICLVVNEPIESKNLTGGISSDGPWKMYRRDDLVNA